jgi:glucose/arabinose dehydrogenase
MSVTGFSAAALLGTTRTAAVRVPSLRVLGTIATGIAVPWGLAFLPDGSAVVGERDSGTVLHVTKAGAKSVIGRIAVHHTNENGLLGLAVSTAFATDRFVYAYRTTTSGNEVIRLHWPAGGRLGSLRVLLTGIAAYDHHDGGRLGFGPDGYLYVSTGDAYVPARSQDRFSLNGKILRITALGAPAPRNPFDGRTGSRYVWSYGHRNVEGFGWDTQKRMWSCEFGDHAWDELNHILPGRNYGWPLAEGDSTIRGLTNPVEEWRTPTASPSGLAVVNDIVYFGALQGQEIWQVDVHTGKAGATKAWFHQRYGRIRTVVAAPDGSLWVTTSNTDGRAIPRAGDDRILRVGLHY